MIILIDIDGTLRNIWASFCTLAQYVAPDIKFPQEGPDTYWFLEEYVDHPKYEQLLNIWQKPGFFSNAVPYQHAIEAVRALETRPEFTVFLVTQPMLKSETAHSENVAWVRHNLGQEWEERLIQTHDRTLIQADILIDDKPEIKGIAYPTWEHIVYDQPYNRHTNHERRLMDWSAFADGVGEFPEEAY